MFWYKIILLDYTIFLSREVEGKTKEGRKPKHKIFLPAGIDCHFTAFPPLMECFKFPYPFPHTNSLGQEDSFLVLSL